MEKKTFLNSLVLITLISISISGFSQDYNKNTWPQFRGINCSGVAHPDHKPPIDLESAEKIIWKTPIISAVCWARSIGLVYIAAILFPFRLFAVSSTSPTPSGLKAKLSSRP